MITTFDYIDAACNVASVTPELVRERTKAIRVVAGFHIEDPALEAEQAAAADAQLEAAVLAQVAAAEEFRTDRNTALALCTERHIKPLAIVPATTWEHLCEATGLYRLSPDADGLVGFSKDAFAGIKDARGMTAAEQVEWLAANRRDDFLRRLFPRGVSVPPVGYVATLVMPVPPPDVAECLLKAKDLDLKVATVADAIAFKETPTELYNRAISREAAQAHWLRLDPIIYFTVGSATAIIAQFGDFPIESEVVDRVLSAETLMRYFPDQVR